MIDSIWNMLLALVGKCTHFKIPQNISITLEEEYERDQNVIMSAEFDLRCI